MQIERIIELVIILMSEIHKKESVEELDITKFEKAGYSNIEISTAVSWLIDENANFLKPIHDLQNKDKSFRILSQVEQDLFTVEAWGEVIQMLSLGLINYETIELLIERSLLGGIYKIDGRFLRYFLAYYLFDINITGYPNNRYVLAGNETIN